MARITLDSIAHAYGGNPATDKDYALKRLEYVWEQGMAYALLGPSGCGKTTLLNIISGLVIPSEGRLLFDDVDVTHLPTKQRNIAQVFQFPVIYDTMTVAENLAFPLKNRKLPKLAIERRVTEIAAMLDLTGVLNRRARGLTADAKQKISLGRGLVRADVSAVLFDEPLTVIDPSLKWELRSKLKAVHRALDLLMIYVTHDQIEALTFADKVVVMNEGKAVQIGTPADLFERPEHTFVGYFIGSPGMNLMPAKVSGSRALVDGAELQLGAAYRDLPKSGRIQIGVRPDYTELSSAAGLAVQVRRIADLGRKRLAYVTLGLIRSSPPSLPRSPRRRSSEGRFRSGAYPRLCRRHSRDGSGGMTGKPINNRAWLFVLPVLAFVLFSSIIPVMTVVNYSIQDTMGANNFFWNGDAWFRDLLNPSTEIGGEVQRRAVPHPRVLARLPLDRSAARHRDRALRAAKRVAGRPLAGGDGAADADSMECRGHHLADLRPPGHRPVWSGADRPWPALQRDAGPDFRLDHHRRHRCLALDAAGHSVELRRIAGDPRRLLSGGQIDGASRWAIFFNIELPKLQKVLVIAVLLRFMQTFMIYTEPFVVTGGGPGSATTFLSIDLVKIALGQVDLGSAAVHVACLQSDHAHRLLGLLHDHDPT